MCFICSWIFGNFEGREIRSEGTKVLGVCCCIKNYAKAQWLQTMNIDYHMVSVGQKFGSNIIGVQALGFLGCCHHVGRGWSLTDRGLTRTGRSTFKMTRSCDHWQEASVPHLRGLCRGCLSVFMIWHLTSPRVRDPRGSEQRGSCSVVTESLKLSLY